MDQDEIIQHAKDLLSRRGFIVSDHTNLIEALTQTLESEMHRTEWLESHVPISVRQPLDPAAQGAREERRRATVMFADICGFTALSETMDPEDVIRLLNCIFEVIVRAVRRHGGSVDKFLGDAALVNFGIPHAHEDDPKRAVLTAIEIVDGIDHLNTQPQSNLIKAPLNISIGINSGLLVAGTIGALDRREYTVIGDTVNLASRLRDLASPGEILIDEATYQAIQDSFECTSLGLKSVKGKTEQIEVYRIGARTGDPVSTLFKSSPFVGRQSEIQQLNEAYESVVCGAVHHVRIVGPAGSGKSRLITEFIRHHPELLNRCVWIKGEFEERSNPLSCLKTALDRMLLMLSSHSKPRAMARLRAIMRSGGLNRAEIARINDVIVDSFIPELMKDAAKKTRSDDLFQAVSKTLESVSAQNTLVIIWENFQWIDPVSRSVYYHLREALKLSRILFLITDRQPDSDSSCTRIDISGIGQESALQLTQQLLALMGLHESPQWVVSNTGDNPLQIELFVQFLARRAAIPDTHSTDLPMNLVNLIQSQVDLLPEMDKRVIEWMAVAGIPIRYEQLDAVMGNHRERTRESVWDLIETGFVERDTSGQFIRFRQDLFRQVIYETILNERRREMHGKMGACLALDLVPAPERSDTLAWHYERSHDPILAIPYLEICAQNANKRFLYDIALSYYKRGIELMKSAGSDGSALVTDEWRFYFRIGQLLYIQGKINEAKDWFNRALKLSKQFRVDSKRAQSLMKIGDIHVDHGELADALPYYEEARRIYSVITDPDGELQAVNAIGIVLMQRGERDRAEALYREGISLVDLTDSHQLAGMLYANIGILHSMQGDHLSAVNEFLESEHHFSEAGILEGVAQALHNLGMTYEKTMEWQRAAYYYQRSQSVSQEIGDKSMTAITILNRSNAVFQTGDLPLAHGLAVQALTRMRSLNNQVGYADACLILGRVLMRMGNEKKARGYFAVSLRVNRMCDYIEGIAHSALQYGLSLKNQKRTVRARTQLGIAREAFLKLGDNAQVNEIDRILSP